MEPSSLEDPGEVEEGSVCIVFDQHFDVLPRQLLPVAIIMSVAILP